MYTAFQKFGVSKVFFYKEIKIVFSLDTLNESHDF